MKSAKLMKYLHPPFLKTKSLCAIAFAAILSFHGNGRAPLSPFSYRLPSYAHDLAYLFHITQHQRHIGRLSAVVPGSRPPVFPLSVTYGSSSARFSATRFQVFPFLFSAKRQAVWLKRKAFQTENALRERSTRGR